jgi:hypothetical protein
MSDILVGYRQPKLEIGKLLHGRFVFMGSMWRYGRSLAPIPSVLGGMAVQVAKAAADIVTLGLGLNRWGQLQRLQPVPRSLQDEWPVLYDRLHSGAQ